MSHQFRIETLSALEAEGKFVNLRKGLCVRQQRHRNKRVAANRKMANWGRFFS